MADPDAVTAIVRGPGRLARLGAWIDERFPMTELWREHASEYWAPKNFNFWYYFGSLALFVLCCRSSRASS
jgi:ubiquinol-cytochrome c reductase cytochrome b subunit